MMTSHPRGSFESLETETFTCYHRRDLISTAGIICRKKVLVFSQVIILKALISFCEM